MSPGSALVAAAVGAAALSACSTEVLTLLEPSGASSGGAPTDPTPTAPGSSDGGAPPTGGSAPTGGGTSTGGASESGGAPTGGAPATGGDGSGGDAGGQGGQPTPVLPALVDDFADCDDAIPEVDGRVGAWYPFTNPAEAIDGVGYTVGLPPTASWGTQTCGVYLVGGCEGCVAVGLGVPLSDGPWDLSAYTGIRVSFESDTNLWIVVKTYDGPVEGYSEYALAPATGGESGTREVYLQAMLPGVDFHGYENAYDLQFTVGDGDRESFGFGIHRVELF